ncbi:DMT family transporter [Chloroflexota bacterium]
METGLILALLSSITFAGNVIFARRVSYNTGESFTSVLFSIFSGVPIFAVALSATGGWGELWTASGLAIGLFALAGIIHFVVGRQLSYISFRLIGANRGGAIVKTQMLYSVIFGIIFLHEPVSLSLILGVFGIAIGVTLVSIEKGEEAGKVRARGVLAAFTGAVCWGISGVIVKYGFMEIASPYVAAFVAHVAASLSIATFLLGKKQRKHVSAFNRTAVLGIIGVSLSASIAQLFRYVALSFSPVSVVIPIIGTNVVFILFLSFIFNRQIELFTWKVIVGIVAASLGTLLLFL